MCHFLYICFYIISDLYNHLSAMFLFFIISVYLSSVYIVSFYKFVFYILSRHPYLYEIINFRKEKCCSLSSYFLSQIELINSCF